MMNSATIFIQQSPDFQFLSVCHYITTFGIIFYNRNLIALNDRNQSIPVLNILFEHLHKSKNESETKLQLLKIVLKGTDIYGGGDGETLDMKYVNETYQYIISEVLFSHYGNINGYLAKIIYQADNVHYFALRKTVIHKLHKNYITRDYCSLSNGTTQLTKLAIRKVFEDHIWSIFPQPEQDMSIIDVNYIYAMVGLKIVRSVGTDIADLKFHEYILISREIDLQQFNNETYEIALKLFSTPALFFYAFKLKDKYRKMEELRTRNQFILNDEFWSEVFENLFSYINNSVQETVNKGIENSLYYKLDKEINNLMSRTQMAYEILKVFCHYDNVAQVSELHVGIYKTFYHWITKLLLPSRCNTDDLFKLDDVYEDQFTEVEKIYNQIEQSVITNVLIYGKLVERMNSNVSVLFARVPDYQQGCTYCPPPSRSKNKDIYLLFAIKEGKKNDFYAFRQESNTLSLLTGSGNEREFAQAVANDASLKMEIAITANPLKLRWENYKMFVQRVAEIKTKQFLKGLKEYYYDEALGEKFLNIFKAFIPFYSCVESIRAGDKAGAVLSCSLDVLSLIPMAGFAAKYTTQLGSSIVKEIGNHYLITNSLAKLGTIVKVPIITALNQITKMAVQTVAREILTRGFLTDLALASLRSVDPGFELFYQISNYGFKTFRKLFRNIIARFRNIPAVAHNLSIIKNIFRIIKKSMNLISDETGLVPLILVNQNGYNIVRYFYPGGSNPFGPTCLTSYGRTAELRSIEGYPFEIAVMPVKSSGDVTHYKQYIPETGRILDTKLQMGKNDILRRVGYLLDELFADGVNINLFRNYHVYHNTINWKNPPLKPKGTENINPPTLGPRFSNDDIQQEGSLFSGNARIVSENGFPLQHYFPQPRPLFLPGQQFSEGGHSISLEGNAESYNFRIPDPELQASQTENLGFSSPQMRNSEFSGTVGGDNRDHNVPEIVETERAGTSKEFAKTNINVPEAASPDIFQSLEEFLVFRNKGEKLSDPVPAKTNINVPQGVSPDILQSLKEFLLLRQNAAKLSDSVPAKTNINFPQSVSPDDLQSLKEFLVFRQNAPELSDPVPAKTNIKAPQGVSPEILQSLKEFLVLRQNAAKLSDPVPRNIVKSNPPQIQESESPGTSKGNTKTDSNFDNQQLSLTLNDLLLSGENPPSVTKSFPTKKVHSNFPQDSKSEFSGSGKEISETEHEVLSQSVKSKKPPYIRGYLAARQYTPWVLKSVQDIIEEYKSLPTPQKIRRLSPSAEVSEFEQYVPKDLDAVSGDSTQFVTHTDPDFYKAIIKEPMYTEYVQVLLNLKKFGLPFLKEDKVKVNFLRTALNKLALFQSDVVVPLQTPTELWYTEIVTLQKQIDFRKNLKGRNYFFNDITMLTIKPPDPFVPKKWESSSLKETEIRYRVTYDSPYGLVDLTHFHEDFRDNYIAFNDMLFTVTDTYFINNNNVLILELKSQGIPEQIWQDNREQDISNLLEDDRTIESPRMKSITNAANFIADNAPLCTFRATRDFLTTYILSPTPSSTNSVPTYEMFAEDFKNMDFRIFYDYWRIKPHPHIQDVLLKSNFDKIIEFSEAERRIREVYGLVYFQGVQEVFENYRKMTGIPQWLRFEDYYVLYSQVKNKLLMSRDGVRRYEAAIIRLSLRQCEMNEITKPITLYRGEMIDREFANSFLSLQKDNQHIIVFDQLKKFSLRESVEVGNILNHPSTSSQIPLLMEITLNNQAGVADLGHVLGDGSKFHVVTADFEFTLDEAVFEEIRGQDVLILRMHDFKSPTEKRMVQMAKKLDELFSTETKYYSD